MSYDAQRQENSIEGGEAGLSVNRQILAYQVILFLNFYGHRTINQFSLCPKFPTVETESWEARANAQTNKLRQIQPQDTRTFYSQTAA